MAKHLEASNCIPIQFTTVKKQSGLETQIKTCKNVSTNLFEYFLTARKYCKNPCHVVEYFGRSQEWIGHGLPGTLTLNIYFVSNDVKVQEQYFIYSTVDLIGIVGGNLGLFMGFSFFGYIGQFLSYIKDKLQTD